MRKILALLLLGHLTFTWGALAKNQSSHREGSGEWTGHLEVWKIIGVRYPLNKMLYIGLNGRVYVKIFRPAKIFRLVLKTGDVVWGDDINEILTYWSDRSGNFYVDYVYIKRLGFISIQDIDWILFK